MTDRIGSALKDYVSSVREEEKGGKPDATKEAAELPLDVRQALYLNASQCPVIHSGGEVLLGP